MMSTVNTIEARTSPESLRDFRRGQPVRDSGHQAVRHLLKRVTSLLGILNRSGILECPVQPLHLAWKHGTGVSGATADGNDVIELLAHELRDRLGMQV